MVKYISKKLIFALLVVTLFLSFIVNILFNKDSKLDVSPIKIIKKDGSDKIIGARIHQQNKKGEKFLIIAETLHESTTEQNKIILENSITTINQNGILTNISAGHAVVSKNYKNFDFSNKVKITKKNRKFTLESETLIGTIDKGNFYTNDNVYIVSGNTKIRGYGLDLRKNGEYIKVKGKAVLTMLLSEKNEN